MPILFLTVLLSGLGFGLVLPGFLFFAENLGASPALATAIIATYSLGQFIATPVWGRASDRYGRKPVLVITMAGAVLSYLLLAYATNLWVLAVARFLNGIMAGNLAVAMAYASDATPPERRAQGMGRVGGAISLGFIIGPALGGALGGADAASATLRLPGLVAAGVCAFTLVATLALLRESLPAAKRQSAERLKSEPGLLGSFAQVARRPVLGRLVAVAFAVSLAMGVFETIFPLWSNARFGWGPREVGWSFTYLGLLVAIVQGLLVGLLVPRFGEHRLVITGLCAYVAGLLIMTQAPAWPLMMAGITFTAAGGALYTTTIASLVSQQASADERGLVLGVFQSAAWLARTLGPPGGGLLFSSLGTNAPLLAGAAMILPCIFAVSLTLARAERGGGSRGAA